MRIVRSFLVFVAALWLGLAPAWAAIKTSTAAGNSSAGGTWVGGVAPVTGDQLVINHAITIDASLITGTSPPQTPTVLPTIALASGATLTSLPTGTYRYTYTHVDAGGKESAEVASDQSTGAITNGVSKPRVTLGALPSGVTSFNLYLSDTGGATGSCHLYASGITATTYDLVSASYTNGTNAYAAAVAIPNSVAVTVNSGGSLVIATGQQLTCRGDLWLINTSLTLNGTAILEFDPSSAGTASTDEMYLWGGNTNTQASTKILTSGTSSGTRATIRTNATAGNKPARILPYLTAFGTATDSLFVNLSYCNFTRLGSSSGHAITFSPSATAFVDVFDHCIFDTCARTNFGNSPGGAGWNFTFCSWKNSVAGTNPIQVAASAALTTGTRTIDHCVFDLSPNICSKDSTYTNNYFDVPYAISGGANVWAAFTGNFVRNTFAVGDFPSSGDMTNCVIMGDSAPTAAVSGTATSGSSTTLVDSTKSWTVNQYQAVGTGLTSGWGVVIYSGTGLGQGRIILSNTATALTVNRAWDTNPDATSLYRIYGCVANPHYVGASTAPASSTINLTGNIFQGVLFDNNGDCFLHMDAVTTTYNVTGNIILPNVARDNSGSFITLGTTDNTSTYTLNHNTFFTGAQAGWLNESGAQLTITSATTTVLTVAATAGVTDGDLIKFTSATTTAALRNVTATLSSHTGTTLTLGSTLPATPVAGDTFYYTIQPNRIVAFKSNIAWAEPGKTYIPGGGSSFGGPWKLYDVTGAGAARPNTTQDIVSVTATVSNADYNCGYANATNGYSDTTNGLGGGGYDVNSSVIMGTHDVNGDPNFVDRWRSIWGWAASLGSTGDPFDLIKDMRLKLKAANDVNDANYDARYTIAALRTYIIAGLAPQNSALHNTGHDGTDIGAVTVVSASNPVPTINGGMRRRVSIKKPLDILDTSRRLRRKAG